MRKVYTEPSRSGFTLIELLIVISIIGVLSTLLLANFNAARERARDTERKSDLRNIQTALRLYYNDKKSFPTSSSELIQGCDPGATSSCSWGDPWTAGSVTYMSALPVDPLSPDQDYSYSQTDSDTYTLKTCLENASDSKCITDTSCNSSCAYIVSP